MSLTVPPSVNYPSPLVSLPTVYDRSPSEGSRFMQAEIDWGAMGGPANCVDFNLYGGAAQTISQIVAISVDNSLCGADVAFIFPDTGQTYTVPAYTPQAVFPVFTNTTNFYASAPNALSSDITRLAIHNSLPPPTAVPITQQQETAIQSSVAMAVGTTSMVASSVSGTVEAISISAAVPLNSASFNQAVSLEDGTGKVICTGNIAANSNTTANGLLINLSPINVRFSQGLKIVQSGGTVSGTFDVNVFYRVP